MGVKVFDRRDFDRRPCHSAKIASGFACQAWCSTSNLSFVIRLMNGVFNLQISLAMVEFELYVHENAAHHNLLINLMYA